MATQKTTDPVSELERFTALSEALTAAVPQLAAVLTDPEDFRAIHLKRQPDGGILAVLKAYGPDGGEVVCFGSGYGVVGAFMSINGTVTAGRWRVDEPYSP